MSIVSGPGGWLKVNRWDLIVPISFFIRWACPFP